mgnify:CR=1 FL=1
MEINFKALLPICPLLFFSVANAQDNYFYQNNTKVTLTPVPPLTRSLISTSQEKTVNYYHTDQGYQVGVYNKLLVKFKPSDDLDPYLLLSPYDIEIDKQLGHLLYLLIVPSNDLAIDIANRLSEQDFIEYAHPDFIKQLRTR